MSYLSWIKSLPTALQEPSGIATLVSVGIHGLMWVILPVLPMASKTTEAEIKKPVELVELTPAELSRLPNFATPQLSLPPLPKSTNLYPPLPPLQSSGAFPPPSSSLSNLPPLFPPPPGALSFSPTTPLPPPSITPPITSIPIPDRPPSTPERPRSSIVFQPQPGLDELQRNSQLDQGAGPSQFPQLESSTTSSVDLEPTTPSSTPPLATNPTTETPPTSEASPTPVETRPPAQEQAATSPQEQAAATPPAPAAPTNRPASIPAAGLAEFRAAQQRYRELYTYDPAGTTPEAVTSNLETWSQQVLEAAGKDWQKVDVTPTYPEAACPRKLAGTAVFGVLVNGEGQIVDAPVLIQSTGYKLLNEQAEATVKAYEFEAKGQQQHYLVHLPFTHSEEACANAPSEPAPVS